MSIILKLVFKLICASWLYYLAQIAVTSSLWLSGIDKLTNFDATMNEMQQDNLTPVELFAALTVFVQLAGSALAIFGRKWAWLGSGALGVFTILTVLLVHHFWTFSGIEYTAELETFKRHVTLLAGLTLSAIASVARYNSGQFSYRK